MSLTAQEAAHQIRDKNNHDIQTHISSANELINKAIEERKYECRYYSNSSEPILQTVKHHYINIGYAATVNIKKNLLDDSFIDIKWDHFRG